MEIEGIIIEVLPAREGTSARGPWKSQDYVIQTDEQYPKRCVFNVFGSDRIDSFKIQKDQKLKVSFDIDAHEFQGRWYNSIRAWKVENIGEADVQPQPGTVIPGAQPAPFPPQPDNAGGSDDDLPF
ncbi:MAG: DUF3127 domain-containing protein [Prevotella sp.]|nr:DUF3127 domain-containing protein [Prevotella sp.]